MLPQDPNSNACLLQLLQVELTKCPLQPHHTSTPGSAIANVLIYKPVTHKRLPILFTVTVSKSSAEASIVQK